MGKRLKSGLKTLKAMINVSFKPLEEEDKGKRLYSGHARTIAVVVSNQLWLPAMRP